MPPLEDNDSGHNPGPQRGSRTAETRRRPGGLVRYLRIYKTLWRNAVVREMSFKASFIMWIVVEILWFGFQLAFIAVLYRHTNDIATWTQWEVVMLMGTSNLIQQLFSGFFLNNLVQLSDDIRYGRLDFLLLLPVNTRFLISLRYVDLGAFVNAAFAAAVVVYAANRLGLSPGPWAIVGYLVLCGTGIIIHYSLMYILASVGFWTVRAQGIIWCYYNLFNVARLPEAAFHGSFKVFFTFVLPMLLVANVPVKLLVERLQSPWELLLLILMTGICFAVSEIFWRMSVRHYTSASS